MFGIICVYVQLEITKTISFFFKECITRENSMNIKMFKAALAGLVLSVSGFANAGLITEEINFTFESGATFIGSIEIEDDYSSITSVDGLLLGGTNNYNSVFDVMWWGAGNAVDHNSDGNLNDWLYGSNFVDYIGLSWDQSASISNNAFTLTIINEGSGVYYSGLITFDDKIVEQRVSQVPEPYTLAIFALGIMGLAARRMKKQS